MCFPTDDKLQSQIKVRRILPRAVAPGIRSTRRSKEDASHYPRTGSKRSRRPNSNSSWESRGVSRFCPNVVSGLGRDKLQRSPTAVSIRRICIVKSEVVSPVMIEIERDSVIWPNVPIGRCVHNFGGGRLRQSKDTGSRAGGEVYMFRCLWTDSERLAFWRGPRVCLIKAS